MAETGELVSADVRHPGRGGGPPSAGGPRGVPA